MEKRTIVRHSYVNRWLFVNSSSDLLWWKHEAHAKCLWKRARLLTEQHGYCYLKKSSPFLQAWHRKVSEENKGKLVYWQRRRSQAHIFPTFKKSAQADFGAKMVHITHQPPPALICHDEKCLLIKKNPAKQGVGSLLQAKTVWICICQPWISNFKDMIWSWNLNLGIKNILYTYFDMKLQVFIHGIDVVEDILHYPGDDAHCICVMKIPLHTDSKSMWWWQVQMHVIRE